MKKAECFFF